MAKTAPGIGDMYILRLGPTTVQQTASAASVLVRKVPFTGVIMKVASGVEAIGGSTDPTDVDIDLENGTTDIHATLMAPVDSSAVCAAMRAAWGHCPG